MQNCSIYLPNPKYARVKYLLAIFQQLFLANYKYVLGNIIQLEKNKTQKLAYVNSTHK